MPGGGRIRLSGQAGEHRAAAVGAAHVAAPLSRERAKMSEQEKVNILLVDDQPAKLLELRSHPARAGREPASRLHQAGRRWSTS